MDEIDSQYSSGKTGGGGGGQGCGRLGDLVSCCFQVLDESAK